ncbi:MAG: T9SS type A sorting domain-containing protein [Ignavibacteriales bacterium]|nr:MAG: T9SS type A sorting domain-containing protein [Ignavibacteriales bacterium]
MKHFFKLLIITVVLQTTLFAQTIVNVPSDAPGSAGNLNNAVQQAITNGTLSTTVFNLEHFGYYVLSGLITIPMGEHLRITAPEPGTTQLTSPPQILWTPDDLVNRDFMFQCLGDLTMSNVWLRYADESGAQVSSQIRFIGDTLGTSQVRGTFENVIFDYSPTPQVGAGGSVTVTANHFVGKFKNCYWKNCIDTHLRYYGRAVSFPYESTKWHIDSLLFENCTFSNIGYVYMQEGSEYGDNVHFNHCTFHNVNMFTLESGWWYKMSVTNSLFVNTYMYGKRPLDGDAINGGTISIALVDSFGFTVPFTDQDRRILFANNNYVIEPWLVDWMANSPWAQFLTQQRREDEIPEPQPMLNNQTIAFFDSVDGGGNKVYPYMNSVNLYDGIDPGLILSPTNIDSIKPWLNCKWDSGCDVNYAWKPDNGWFQLWPLEENMAYTNDVIKTAALGGFPLGDLYRWWPNEYNLWKAQADAEYQKIYYALETGDISNISSVEPQPGIVPAEYQLGQNYPNPFNPETKIEYSIPVSGHVTLKIYNMLGQEVASLFEGEQRAGNYLATFNAEGLASGIYMYKLEAGNISLTRKFVLMK